MTLYANFKMALPVRIVMIGMKRRKMKHANSRLGFIFIFDSSSTPFSSSQPSEDP
jgi:hypothetical protein